MQTGIFNMSKVQPLDMVLHNNFKCLDSQYFISCSLASQTGWAGKPGVTLNLVSCCSYQFWHPVNMQNCLIPVQLQLV